MYWTHHSDKWPKLRALKNADGSALLSVFERDSSDDEKREAFQIVSSALKTNPGMAREILHGAMQGLVIMAIQGPADMGIDRLIVDAFGASAQDDSTGVQSTKRAVLRSLFFSAVDGEDPTAAERAVDLLASLKDADPDITVPAIRDYSGNEQEGISPRAAIETYKLQVR